MMQSSFWVLVEPNPSQKFRYSLGGAVPYLASWEDMALCLPKAEDWPPSLRRRVRAYVARRSWLTGTREPSLRAGANWLRGWA
jgi:hypothetical protein